MSSYYISFNFESFPKIKIKHFCKKKNTMRESGTHTCPLYVDLTTWHVIE